MVDQNEGSKGTCEEKKKKRAIALAGGGPAVGLHIGALRYFEEHGIEFDVWALSCIGAWAGIVYNQFDEPKQENQEDGGEEGKAKKKTRSDLTYEFFKEFVFRNDASYEKFPMNAVFGPDWIGNAETLMDFWWDRNSYRGLFQPAEIMKSAQDTMNLMRNPNRWTEGDFNAWMLNSVLAPNPMVRFWMSMMYKSNITGLSKLYYPDSACLSCIDFDALRNKNKPFLFHNAWNLSKQKLELFANQTVNKEGNKLKSRYAPITAASLCACSALPFVEETVEIDGDTYCEGALIDTVNFKNLIEDHPYLDEIWVIRIVDDGQVRKPENLHDSLANLCQLFAATVGEDDIKLFRYHVEKKGEWKGIVIEMSVPNKVNYKWSHSNLLNARNLGYSAAEKAWDRYIKEKGEKKDDKVLFLGAEDEIRNARDKVRADQNTVGPQ